MNARTRLSSKGQIVIPKDIRDALQLEPGEFLDIVREGRRIVLQAAEPARGKISYAEFRRRIPRHEGPAVTIEEMNSAVDAMFTAKGRE
ncbi:AbrB/MazE/SpoVT family DNA-binding domain-containing protein [Sphingomonas prati]|uniref:AbrB family looped-hinge helix DNA binding protein n=1 Tax=Sphingomonas prati TaxID=1843237 RepID=A0A7W9BS81_9SPHN|nr:AbrB/MazE/SpoVT family DNA-binding domain-containing protein [Sphingomonas prati]MBB5728633.1 AbrB family looped-hinge helix DNA binding protein [Sphingomonas prati]